MAGPFFFAWVDASETTFNVATHLRMDETLLSVAGEHGEGAFPTLSLVIKNPYVGLLAVGRKQWAWLSFQDGTTIVPLFFGQLVGYPAGMTGEKITLQFVGNPLDCVAQQNAIAATLKVAPFYDPVFISPELRSDPNTVLEGYSARWHIARPSLQVSISDILFGEDGTEEFLESDGFYSSLDVSIDQPPLTQTSVVATVNWTQTAAGQINFGTRIFLSYTGQQLISDWPKSGAALSAGYSVAAASAKDVYAVEQAQSVSHSYSWQNQSQHHADGDTMSIQESDSAPILLGPYIENVTRDDVQVGVLDSSTGINIPSTKNYESTIIPLWNIQTSLVLGYQASRKRTETLKLTLTADLQPVLTRPPTADPSSAITLSGADVGIPIDGVAPIGDLARRSYFPTDRGLQSVEYAISVARAKLLAGARVGKIRRRIHFQRAIYLSCRMNALIHDHRIGGGSAFGKITNYKYSANVTAGLYDGEITIGSAIGSGGSVTAVAGSNDYIAGDYIAAGYYVQAGATIAFPTTDVAYSPPIDAVNDDGLVFPLTKAQVVVSETVVGSATTQAAALNTGSALALYAPYSSPLIDEIKQQAAAAAAAAIAALKDMPVYYQLELKPLTGSFAVEYELAPTLTVPKMIDLAAPASP